MKSLRSNPLAAMCKKPGASVLQTACPLLVLLVLTSSSYGNPSYKGEDSSKNKVVDFNVHISESGEKYDEKIEINTEKQTELFKVPAHPGVDRSDVLHDFKQKLAMVRLPESNACYLLPLAKDMSTPEKLITDLEIAEQKNITGGRRTDITWIVRGELNERSFLSDDLQQFCAEYPIYLVKKAQDSLATTRIETGEITRRMRRRRSCGMNCLCPGGMDLSTAFNYCWKPDLKCKVQTRTCYKFVTCPVGGPSERPPPSVVNTFRTNDGDLCWEHHIFSNIVCCEYICQ